MGNIKFTKTKSTIGTGWIWLAIDKYNRTGTGRSQAEALGDYFLGYNAITLSNEYQSEMDIAPEFLEQK